jgi:hypothetical protein
MAILKRSHHGLADGAGRTHNNDLHAFRLPMNNDIDQSVPGTKAGDFSRTLSR